LSDTPGAADSAEGDLSVDAEWTVRMLVAFIREELQRTGKRRLVLGLSGGIDSAVAAYLAQLAVGAGNVLPLLLPYRTSSASSVTDALSVVRELGLRHERLDISPLVDAAAGLIGDADPVRLGNVMARSRMLLLYDRSARHDALVLGTSNKTELLLGYGTLHGDLASAINPVGDLYKTQVRHLAEHLGVPEPIRRKAPSADLWPDQSDEQDLGLSYDDADRMLALLVDARIPPAGLVERGFPAAQVERLTRMMVRSQFKRMPPVIAKVSTRSIGWDFRYPRDWLS
jgi:NAD+ synthase